MRFATSPRSAFVLLLLLTTLPLSAAVATVTNTNDSGPGSLREALANGAVNRIEFAIGTGPQTIQPLSPLPQRSGVVIDGRTQPGYSGTPLIELDGSLTAGGSFEANGLDLTFSDVYGLAVNNFHGIGIWLHGGTVQSCYFGVDVSGTVAKGNAIGIYASGGPSTIGGTNPGDGNLISGNSTGLMAGFGVTVQGNVFGTDAAGTSTLGTQYRHIGLQNAGNVIIGGLAPNVFAGGEIGVSAFDADNVRIHGNYFGETPAGVSMPMRWAIVLDKSDDNIVHANIIRNAETAIIVRDVSIRNQILGNSIDGNGFGIDLSVYPETNQSTPNDAGDGDTGPNNLVNYPVLDAPTVANGQTTVSGTLSSVANRTYRIEVFVSPACNAAGYGPGRDMLDAFDVTTDGGGNASFSRTVAGAYAPGTTFAATSTSALEGTSEFSQCATVTGPGQFSFIGTTAAVTESGSKSVGVRRLLGSVGTASVTYSVTGGTASPSDFSGAAGTLDFAAGEVEKKIVVQTASDSTYEGDESIVLTLSNPTGGATLGTPSSFTVTIQDDDLPPAVTFQTIGVQEGDAGTTVAQMPVRLSQAQAVPLTVPYTINNYSGATPGVDFVAGSGSVTFAPGETEKLVPVTIIGDTAWEPTETLYVQKSTAPYTAGYVNILNDDPVPVVSVQNLTVVEGNGRKTVNVTLTAPVPVYGSVFVTLIGGSAQPALDFEPRTDWVPFYSETSKTFAIEILGDTEPEPDERFEVSLWSYTPANIEAGPNGVVTIVNDDLGVGPAERWIAAGEKGAFTVALGQSTTQAETIAVTNDDPSGVSVPATIVIPSGQSFIDFEATALAAGHDANITLTFPPALGGGTKTVRARTYQRATLRFSPARVTVLEGKTATVAVSLDPPSAKAVTIGLRSTERASVPASLTIPPGGSASFVVTAKKIGAFTIDAQLPEVHGNEVQSLPGEVIAPPTTPTILSITPSHGPTSGGTEVTIHGANLRSGCVVRFGGVLGSSISFVNASSMTAITPPHAGGSVDVLLTCGSDTFTFANGFGYVSEAPRVTQVSPSSGTTAGGTHVRVGGANFDGTCWLFFGRSAATNVVVRSADSLTGVAPPHAVGASDVTVRCSAGTATLPVAFTYRDQNDPAPLITEVVPAAAAPGELVTVRGLNFRPTDSAMVDTTTATIVDPSPDSHVLRVPELPAGRASISVTDLFGQTTTSGPVFSVLEARPPRITAVNPSRVPAGGEVELTGEGFRPGYTFEIGGHAATIVSSEYTRAIVRVASIVAPGSHAVNVRNRADALAAIGPNVEIVSDGMVVTSADPRCTTTDGGIYATIRGRGFASGVTASFDGVQSPDVAVIDANTLRVQVPAGAAGPVRITVVDASGHTATLTGGFEYASAFDPRGCGGRSRSVRH